MCGFIGKLVQRGTSNAVKNMGQEALNLGLVVVLARSHMNGSTPFDRTIEQTTETMLLAKNNNNSYSLMTNGITILRELLHFP